VVSILYISSAVFGTVNVHVTAVQLDVIYLHIFPQSEPPK